MIQQNSADGVVGEVTSRRRSQESKIWVLTLIWLEIPANYIRLWHPPPRKKVHNQQFFSANPVIDKYGVRIHSALQYR